MKYKVVENPIIYDFETEVNKLIEYGWKPLGGVTYSGSYCHVETYIQAMVLEGE